MEAIKEVDVVILGAGLAGLTLARQLLLNSSKRILVLEKRDIVPSDRQKIGESTVQLGGYYFSKVLDMEEYLVHEHVMKYNLRFSWRSKQQTNDDIAHYSHSYIRNFSNIPSYQLDRNKFEGKLLELNKMSSDFELHTGVKVGEVALNPEGKHRVDYECSGKSFAVDADWLIDATGLGRFLPKKLETRRKMPIDHGSAYFWLNDTINIEKLTAGSNAERRLSKSRRQLGHAPFWMATNHLMGPGYWLWIIPLQGRTSFGLVYDHESVNPGDVSTPERFVTWLKDAFPLLAQTLEDQDLVDPGQLRRYAYDCEQTLSGDRWAMTGVSGRFNDPLYSPGSDLIGVHNTLIVDCILSPNDAVLKSKVSLFETLLKALYRSFLPSYTVSYQTMGDQESFSIKYTWELTIYFGFYVFPFINDLFTDRVFVAGYFKRVSQLGSLNGSIQHYLNDYYHWKIEQAVDGNSEPIYFDFMKMCPLKKAESTFYEVGLTAREALNVLDQQLDSIREFARFIVVYIDSVVVGNSALIHCEDYVGKLDVNSRKFCVPSIIEAADSSLQVPGEQSYSWCMDPDVLYSFFGKSHD